MNGPQGFVQSIVGGHVTAGGAPGGPDLAATQGQVQALLAALQDTSANAPGNWNAHWQQFSVDAAGIPQQVAYLANPNVYPLTGPSGASGPTAQLQTDANDLAVAMADLQTGMQLVGPGYIQGLTNAIALLGELATARQQIAQLTQQLTQTKGQVQSLTVKNTHLEGIVAGFGGGRGSGASQQPPQGSGTTAGGAPSGSGTTGGAGGNGSVVKGGVAPPKTVSYGVCAAIATTSLLAGGLAGVAGMHFYYKGKGAGEAGEAGEAAAPLAETKPRKKKEART